MQIVGIGEVIAMELWRSDCTRLARACEMMAAMDSDADAVYEALAGQFMLAAAVTALHGHITPDTSVDGTLTAICDAIYPDQAEARRARLRERLTSEEYEA